jgi:Heavy metal binding domain
MHPEVRQPGPGSCPKCGMALEPRTISLGEEENPELTDMTRRFRIGAALTVPLVYIAMGGLIPVIAPERFVPMRLLKWLELLRRRRSENLLFLPLRRERRSQKPNELLRGRPCGFVKHMPGGVCRAFQLYRRGCSMEHIKREVECGIAEWTEG